MEHPYKTLRSMLVALGVAGLALVAGTACIAAPLPIDQVFRKPQYGGAVLSPGGRFVAVVAPVGERLGIAVIDLESKAVPVRMETPGTSDVLRIVWQTDDRLIGYLGDRQAASGEPPRQHGIFAVNRDGNDPRVIASYGFRSGHAGMDARGFQRPWTVQLLRVNPGSTEVLVSARERSYRSADVYRFDTETGAKSLLTVDAPGLASGWVLDFDGVPRAVVADDLNSDTSAWYYRATATSPWVKVEEAKLGRLQSSPMQFDPDGKILYVAARRDGDRTAIYEYHVDTGKFGNAIIRHPERDVDDNNASFVSDYRTRKLLGLRYADARPSVAWFDAEWARVQAAVDKALPNTVNRIARTGDSPRWIITAASDRNPGEAYLLDGKSMRMEKLFAFEPWIDAAATTPTRWVRYPARDGLVIPAMLTVPADAQGKRLPLIVDIHGGPNVPATRWGYDPTVQFFASRGYVVLQPQFRGTKGFGWKHESAGFRKWGDEMQDDLEDGIRWAVAEGIVDASRVCLYGGSYGGYAAMWGAIKQASSIKCAVSLAGVTSIDYLFDDATTDLAEIAEKSSIMAEYIGDPKTERARFKRVNPVDNADKVGVPILLAYGESDRRVPLVHGRAFRAALDRYQKPYEWVVYDNEGHGLNRDANLFDFFRRVEAFVDRAIGPAAAGATGAAGAPGTSASRGASAATSAARPPGGAPR